MELTNWDLVILVDDWFLGAQYEG